MPARTAVLSALSGKGLLPPHSHVGRIQLLVGGWTTNLSFLLAVGQKPPSVPCHMSHFISVTASFHKWKQRRKMGWGRERVTIFYILISEVTPHHFCCTLFTKSKSLIPTHTQQRTLYSVVGTGRWGSLRTILEASYSGEHSFCGP